VHPIDFFLKLGFYCEREFLDSRTLTALFERFQQALPVPARVFDGGPDAVVDMAVRNTWQLSLDEVANDINGRIDALRDDVARHFAVPLAGHEGATMLMYPTGGFYETHADSSTDKRSKIIASRRRVSVVIFLNAMRTPPGPSEYSGGALTFYGVVDDPAWRSFGFALAPEPGLLVAFPSHVVHEVTPVTAGDRYTIVDWFPG
jgi:predicted 2-oxoglutarate/Fe(II)-dependent dioxygenase YbiX